MKKRDKIIKTIFSIILAIGIFLFALGLYTWSKDNISTANMLMIGGGIILAGLIFGYIKLSELPKMVKK